jgi:hypothetical protein
MDNYHKKHVSRISSKHLISLFDQEFTKRKKLVTYIGFNLHFQI